MLHESKRKHKSCSILTPRVDFLASSALYRGHQKENGRVCGAGSPLPTAVNLSECCGGCRSRLNAVRGKHPRELLLYQDEKRSKPRELLFVPPGFLQLKDKQIQVVGRKMGKQSDALIVHEHPLSTSKHIQNLGKLTCI